MKIWTLLIVLLVAIVAALVVAYIVVARRLRAAEEALCARFDENGYFIYSGRIHGWPGAKIVSTDAGRSFQDCTERFANLQNFRGEPGGFARGETGPEVMFPLVGEVGPTEYLPRNHPRIDTGD